MATKHVVLKLSGRLDTSLHKALLELPEDDFEFLFGEEFALSRSRVEALIREGKVQIDGKEILRPGKDVEVGMRVTVEVPAPQPSVLQPEPMPLEILFEDRDVLVLNKPAGLVVHPGAGIFSGTLVNALLAHLGEDLRAIGDQLRPGIVHRLDKDTSGVMIVAKNSAAHSHLSSQFLPPRRITRTYHALTFHMPEGGAVREGTIDVPIGRDRGDRTKISPRSESAREAITHWKLLEKFGDTSLLELRLETGRTHQIRVHLEFARSPILGDEVYGPKAGQLPPALREAAALLHRQALHAFRLQFVHPRTEQVMEYSAPYPADFSAALEALRAGQV